MPKENARKHLIKAKEMLKSAREEIDEALRELDEDEFDDGVKDTGFGFIGSDGIERATDSEEYEDDDLE